MQGTNEGHYTESDSYVNHHQISLKPVKFLIVTDRLELNIAPVNCNVFFDVETILFLSAFVCSLLS